MGLPVQPNGRYARRGNANHLSPLVDTGVVVVLLVFPGAKPKSKNKRGSSLSLTCGGLARMNGEGRRPRTSPLPPQTEAKGTTIAATKGC